MNKFVVISMVFGERFFINVSKEEFHNYMNELEEYYTLKYRVNYEMGCRGCYFVYGNTDVELAGFIEYLEGSEDENDKYFVSDYK